MATAPVGVTSSTEEATITTDFAVHEAASADARAAVHITFVSGARSLLLAQRQAHVDNLESLGAAAAQMLDDSQFLDFGGDDGFGEANGSGFELDNIRALMAAARKGLTEADAALARLDSGEYGVCVGCKAPISPARLEAIPEATHCVDCKRGGLRRRN